jgi:hypothetical protein
MHKTASRAYRTVLPSAAVKWEASILEPVALLPRGGVVLGVVLKWAFDALTERGKRKREHPKRRASLVFHSIH